MKRLMVKKVMEEKMFWSFLDLPLVRVSSENLDDQRWSSTST